MELPVNDLYMYMLSMPSSKLEKINLSITMKSVQSEFLSFALSKSVDTLEISRINPGIECS